MRVFVGIILSLHLWLPLGLMAQEAAKQKTAFDYSLTQYGVTLAVALLGGFVGWVNKVRKGELAMFSIFHLIGELATSSLAGLLCFWICEWAGAAPLLTIALVAISGHMGARSIALFEQWAAKRFEQTP